LSDYLDGLTKSDYVPNIVILFAGEYFAMRQPDSGLVIDQKYSGIINRVSINPTSIDPLRASTTFNTSSFTLLDKNRAVSELFLDQNGFRTGQEVQIFLGRSNEGLDFSEYLEMPTTYIKQVTKIDNAYTFSTIERRDRLNNGSYSKISKLAVNILAATTTITLQDLSFLDGATTGFVQIGGEFISFAGVDLDDLNLLGCIRGEFGTVPVDHKLGSNVSLVYSVSPTNAIDLLLQFLISKGGGGIYDVLPEGAGISESLIDVDQFLEVKAAFFSTLDLDFKMYSIASFQRFIEDEILLPLGIRLVSNNNGKLGLALINRNIFQVDAPVISEPVTISSPSFTVTDDKVINRVKVFFDFDDAINDYLGVVEKEDQDSISELGPTSFKEFKFKGIRNRLAVESIANLFLERFSAARPDISVNTNNSVSNLILGDKTEFFSSRLPTTQGNLNFASTLEILKKSYEVSSGTVKYQLAFTSFSGIRQCFIAPSDTAISFVNQKTINIASGRGDCYRAGWKMKLYSNNTREFLGPQVNTIQEIIGDQIIFENDWEYPLVDFVSRIMFADYDEVIEQQKKFCFTNIENEPFDDGTGAYQVTFA
jgi:hypothetical protein